jgi:ferredoxin
MSSPSMGGRSVLDRPGLDALIEVLAGRGFRVIGPTLQDDAIMLAELRSGADLPDGWGVDVAPGSYRLRRRTDGAVFGHSCGQQSWKQFLHQPRRTIWSTDGTTFARTDENPPSYAFIGVRACDLAAISALTRVLARGEHEDADFARRAGGTFIVAVACTEPGPLCFCASLGTGPEPGPHYDLSLTERPRTDGSQFMVTVGSDAGAAVLAEVPHREASADETKEAHAAVAAAAGQMGRALPDTDVPDLLRRTHESPVWTEIASRCLTCGNCTMVCPTCFCTTTEDRTSLSGGQAERSQRWASCFELDFSYVHGGSVRTSGAGRYRQWMTHKLSSWHDQFGSSGCVGCGRCIAWCPAGIDITEEAARLAAVVTGDPDDS